MWPQGTGSVFKDQIWRPGASACWEAYHNHVGLNSVCSCCTSYSHCIFPLTSQCKLFDEQEYAKNRHVLSIIIFGSLLTLYGLGIASTWHFNRILFLSNACTVLTVQIEPRLKKLSYHTIPGGKQLFISQCGVLRFSLEPLERLISSLQLLYSSALSCAMPKCTYISIALVLNQYKAYTELLHYKKQIIFGWALQRGTCMIMLQ